jgi:hypothetical protein
MNKLIQFLLFTSLIINLIFLSGCTTIKETIYLQDIEVSGPINQPPVHVMDDLNFTATISPRFSIGTRSQVNGLVEGHTKVNSEGKFQTEIIEGRLVETPRANIYTFRDNNLAWKMPTVNLGLDIDLQLSKSFAFFFGVDYSVEKQIGVWGGHVGIGSFSVNENRAVRFDVGLNIQTLSYDANTMVSVETTSLFGHDESFLVEYHDIDKSIHFNPFLSLTINTAYRDWLFNIFFNAGYVFQTIVDFEPRTQVTHGLFNTTHITEDLRGESTAGFIHFTPGIYYNISESSRLALGARFFFETQIDELDQSFFILPMVQVDFRF